MGGSGLNASDWVNVAQVSLSLVGTLAVLLTLRLLPHDLALQRREQERQTETWRFEIYQRIDDRVSDLVWRQSGDERLSRVYTPLTAEERRALDAAQAGADQWGAWRTLSEDEKVVYRFDRIFLETLEQMYEVYSRGWVEEELWQKWRGWITTWCQTRYFSYVFEDQYPRLLPGFRTLLAATCDDLGVDRTFRSRLLAPPAGTP